MCKLTSALYMLLYFEGIGNFSDEVALFFRKPIGGAAVDINHMTVYNCCVTALVTSAEVILKKC